MKRLEVLQRVLNWIMVAWSGVIGIGIGIGINDHDWGNVGLYACLLLWVLIAVDERVDNDKLYKTIRQSLKVNTLLTKSQILHEEAILAIVEEAKSKGVRLDYDKLTKANERKALLNDVLRESRLVGKELE